MRMAVIADIHGNIDALGAVLEDIEKQKVDEIVVAGDIVIGSPHSLMCWQKIQSLTCPVIRGNHERYLFDFDAPDAPASWTTERYAPIRQAHQQFSKEDIDAMRKLPAHLTIDDLLIVHASFRNDVDAVKDSSEKELEAMFAPSTEAFIVRAHNHVWFEREWQTRKIFSIGSVGLPLNGDHRAQYAIAEKSHGAWHLEKCAVAYDVEKAVRHYESGYFDVAGPVGKLFRQELITARHELTPFWKQYTEVIDKGELRLEQAVSRYLEEYCVYSK
jgi:predicted phosphodiesterase